VSISFPSRFRFIVRFDMFVSFSFTFSCAWLEGASGPTHLSIIVAQDFYYLQELAAEPFLTIVYKLLQTFFEIAAQVTVIHAEMLAKWIPLVFMNFGACRWFLIHFDTFGVGLNHVH
jgi:hypothetical protein